VSYGRIRIVFHKSLSDFGMMRDKPSKPDGTERRITLRIARKRGDVFLRADFSDLGSYSQVGKALRKLVRDGCLIKIGQGIYARARPSSLDGKPMPMNGLETLREALRRLGVETVPSRAERAYNSGRSEQVPTGRVVGIRGKRVRRKIGYDGFFVTYERAKSRSEEQRRAIKRRQITPMAPITVPEALRLFWEVDRYPILGNEDLRHSMALEEEARERAAIAIPSSDDPPAFVGWLTALRGPKFASDERDVIMEELYRLFDPSYDDEEETTSTSDRS
jgi:hypothetical protein